MCLLTRCVRVYVADRLLPDQRGALWLCMMQYCESCTSPRTPEYLLYLYHTHLRSLPWRHLHPDTKLMEQLFSVRYFAPRPLTPHTDLDMYVTGKLVNLRPWSLAPVSISSLHLQKYSHSSLFLEKSCVSKPLSINLWRLSCGIYWHR